MRAFYWTPPRTRPLSPQGIRLDTGRAKLDTVGMAQFDQFEVWRLNGERWEFSAAFYDFEIASAVARSRGRGVRLLHVTYENGVALAQEVLFEIGSPREHP